MSYMDMNEALDIVNFNNRGASGLSGSKGSRVASYMGAWNSAKDEVKAGIAKYAPALEQIEKNLSRSQTTLSQLMDSAAGSESPQVEEAVIGAQEANEVFNNAIQPMRDALDDLANNNATVEAGEASGQFSAGSPPQVALDNSKKIVKRIAPLVASLASKQKALAQVMSRASSVIKTDAQRRLRELQAQQRAEEIIRRQEEAAKRQEELARAREEAAQRLAEQRLAAEQAREEARARAQADAENRVVMAEQAAMQRQAAAEQAAYAREMAAAQAAARAQAAPAQSYLQATQYYTPPASVPPVSATFAPEQVQEVALPTIVAEGFTPGEFQEFGGGRSGPSEEGLEGMFGLGLTAEQDIQMRVQRILNEAKGIKTPTPQEQVAQAQAKSGPTAQAAKSSMLKMAAGLAAAGLAIVGIGAIAKRTFGGGKKGR